MTQMVMNLPANTGDTVDMGLIPGLGRSPGGGNGNPLQCSCLENSVDREAGRASVHGVAESDMTEHAYNTVQQKSPCPLCLLSLPVSPMMPCISMICLLSLVNQ